MADSPKVVTAKRLLDLAKREGFAFQRTAPGEDGPLLGRLTLDAAAAGRLDGGRYIALCGTEVIPAQRARGSRR
jgi:hypothetical protein